MQRDRRDRKEPWKLELFYYKEPYKGMPQKRIAKYLKEKKLAINVNYLPVCSVMSVEVLQDHLVNVFRFRRVGTSVTHGATASV